MDAKLVKVFGPHGFIKEYQAKHYTKRPHAEHLCILFEGGKVYIPREYIVEVYPLKDNVLKEDHQPAANNTVTTDNGTEKTDILIKSTIKCITDLLMKGRPSEFYSIDSEKLKTSMETVIEAIQRSEISYNDLTLLKRYLKRLRIDIPPGIMASEIFIARLDKWILNLNVVISQM